MVSFRRVIAPSLRNTDPAVALLADLFPEADPPAEAELASVLLEEGAGPNLDFGRLVGRWLELRGRPFEAPEVLQSLNQLADSGAPALDGAFGPGLGAATVTLPMAARLAGNPRNLTSGTFHLARLLDPHPVGGYAAVAVAVAVRCFLGNRGDFVPDVLDVLLTNDAPPSLVEAVRRVPIFRRPESTGADDGDQASVVVRGLEQVFWVLRHERTEVGALGQVRAHGPGAIRLARALVRIRDRVSPGG